MKKLFSKVAAITAGLSVPALTFAQNYNYALDDYSYDTEISDGAAAALGIGMMVVIGISVLIGLAFLIFWIMMLVDLSKRDFEQKSTWMIMLIVSFFLGLHWLAAIVYYFMIKRKNVTGSGSKPMAGGQAPPAQQ